MRRSQFIISAGIGVGASVLAACTTYGKKPEASGDTATTTGVPTTGGPAAEALAATSAVPVGSGAIVGEVVVTGTIKGSAWDNGQANLEGAAVADRFWKLAQTRTEIAEAARSVGLEATEAADVSAAVAQALNSEKPPHILICGGLHFAGDVLALSPETWPG